MRGRERGERETTGRERWWVEPTSLPTIPTLPTVRPPHRGCPPAPRTLGTLGMPTWQPVQDGVVDPTEPTEPPELAVGWSVSALSAVSVACGAVSVRRRAVLVVRPAKAG